jgi:hypothetical protein
MIHHSACVAHPHLHVHVAFSDDDGFGFVKGELRVLCLWGVFFWGRLGVLRSAESAREREEDENERSWDVGRMIESWSKIWSGFDGS